LIRSGIFQALLPEGSLPVLTHALYLSYTVDLDVVVRVVQEIDFGSSHVKFKINKKNVCDRNSFQ
jgi:hypothetical protein